MQSRANINSTEVAEPAGKPGSVVDNHSSRPSVTAGLKQHTRVRVEPTHSTPIWPCSEWGLPCPATLSPQAVGRRQAALLRHGPARQPGKVVAKILVVDRQVIEVSLDVGQAKAKERQGRRIGAQFGNKGGEHVRR